MINKKIYTPIEYLNKDSNGNSIYMKREDFIPFSFGGNKARKAKYFFDEIDKGNYDAIVTYGSSSSNHCRIVANMAAKRNLECYIIGPQESSKETYNSKMMNLFNSKFIIIPVSEVKDTIEKTIKVLESKGKKVYFIEGGGHGNLGTKAYVDCYEEILDFQKDNNIEFDYIFFASGTGTTQAGLVCGKLLNNSKTKIIGISIARKLPRGRDIILDSIYDYLNDNRINLSKDLVEESTLFIDDYTGTKYGSFNTEILDVIRKILIKYGIPLDSTYTGKAFFGMEQYINSNELKGNKILFIHTGGTPLFFDSLKEI